jgi:predicted nucleotidyltransferase
LKFFLNANSSSYLRGLETEFGESTNAIRMELNRFEDAGLLLSFTEGNRKYYQANKSHPLFPDINNILMKFIGLDMVIENVVNKLGKLEKTILCGSFARGCDSDIIDLIFVGPEINKAYLMRLVEKVENMIQRKIRYIVYSGTEFEEHLGRRNGEEMVVLWEWK